MYCRPAVKNHVRISLSPLFADGASEFACQLCFWSEKSLSKNAIPPAPSGNIELVATSKTPHPQAQPWAAPGARTTANRAPQRAPFLKHF